MREISWIIPVKKSTILGCPIFIRQLRFEFNDPSVPHGLIMSKKALSPAEQLQWQALLNSMRSDGSMRRIFEKYFKPELAAAMVNF